MKSSIALILSILMISVSIIGDDCCGLISKDTISISESACSHHMAASPDNHQEQGKKDSTHSNDEHECSMICCIPSVPANFVASTLTFNIVVGTTDFIYKSLKVNEFKEKIPRPPQSIS